MITRRAALADFSRTDPAAVALLEERWARRYGVLPLRLEDGSLLVATSDPLDLDAERAVAFATGHRVRWVEASATEIAQQIGRWYPEIGTRAEPAVLPVEVQHLGFDSGSRDRAPDDSASAIQLVDQLLAEGIQAGASDIHIEPEEQGIAVRHRIDGVLRQSRLLAKSLAPSLVSRVKILSGLDIADRMRPQDGRARIAVRGTVVDLRVSTLPASHGEKIVVRVLDASTGLRTLDAIGFVDTDVARIRSLLEQREGLVLVTGPTGSGKTTTLYAALREVQARGVNVVTVEDPIEYRLPGIVQVQVHEKAGLTFGAALRSIMRQDPDVILVGEIRDRETAEIAIQAALTGHLVFSTLHTNDAVGSVTRLADIGVESYKVASAVKGVVAQRLLRKLCRSCRELSKEPLSPRLRKVAPSGAQLFRAVGCPDCAQTGYRGRLAITEVLIVTPEVERRISVGEPAERLLQAARDGGMRSLWHAGLDHVLSGETSMDELLRVCEIPAEPLPVAARPSGSGPAVRESPRDTGRQRAVSPRGPGALTPRSISSVPLAAPSRLTGENAFELLDEVGGIGGRGERPTILLVEDEDALRGVLRELLEREGYDVVEAADGVAALDAVDRAGPAIVVLDLSLPRLDGYGVLKRLRAKPATALLPVLVLTAHGDEDSEVRVFESGADDFLTKPFRPRALSARLRALLKRAAHAPGL